MARFSQSVGTKGSQRWIQHVVNRAPHLLDARIGIGPITWLSPLATDDYAEYRDEAALDLLGIKPEKRPLSTFWPRGGPQWDALGRSQSGEVILVEAKAHLSELYSPSSGAKAESSVALIQQSLRETQQALGVRDGYDWSKQFYQYANRLAWAYWLDQLNGIPTKLAFVYFIGDIEVGGPTMTSEWQSDIDTVHGTLGLTAPLQFVTDVLIDVSKL